MKFSEYLEKKGLNEKLRSVKVTYDNGKEITTSMSSKLTDDDIKDYFKIGKSFNIGSGSNDKMAKVKKVEILESDLNELHGRIEKMKTVLKRAFKGNAEKMLEVLISTLSDKEADIILQHAERMSVEKYK